MPLRAVMAATGTDRSNDAEMGSASITSVDRFTFAPLTDELAAAVDLLKDLGRPKEAGRLGLRVDVPNELRSRVEGLAKLAVHFLGVLLRERISTARSAAISGAKSRGDNAAGKAVSPDE